MEDSEHGEEEKNDSCECSENDEQCDSDGISKITQKFSGKEDVAKQASKDAVPETDVDGGTEP